MSSNIYQHYQREGKIGSFGFFEDWFECTISITNKFNLLLYILPNYFTCLK